MYIMMTTKYLVVLAILNFSSCLLSGSQKHEDEFSNFYEITDDENVDSTHLFKVECRSKQLLSFQFTSKKEFKEMPHYKVFFPEDKHAMNRDQYTSMKYCQVDLAVEKSPFKVSVFRKGTKDLIWSFDGASFKHKYVQVTTTDPSTKWGLGERFQKRFHTEDGLWTIHNMDRPFLVDSGDHKKSGQTYGHNPLYLAQSTATKSFHVTYFKNTYPMSVEINGNQTVYHTRGGDPHFLLFIGQKKPEPLLIQFHKYIGAGHIPPFWAMGWHQCRWGYKNLGLIENVVAGYNEHGIPLDIVWTDLDYMQQKQDFTIDQNNFPLDRFEKLLGDVRYIPIIDAGVSIKTDFAMEAGRKMDVFIKKNGNNYLANVWPGDVHFVDFLHPNSTEYWMSMLDVLYNKVKFSGLWLDMNEPSNFVDSGSIEQTYRVNHDKSLNNQTLAMDCEHYNAEDPTSPLFHEQVHAYYGHLEIMATFKFFESKKQRPFIISRSNSVGTGHYSGIWTGDNVATWEFLRLSVAGNFLSQIFGIQMVGADICGFDGNTTDELCARWFQLGALYPFARTHNINHTNGQEPFRVGQLTLKTSNLSLRLRYSILKQYYSIFVKMKGLGSLFRPLFFEFPDDADCYLNHVAEEQFMIGQFLMSAPILSQYTQSRPTYFPGNWYDYWTGKVFNGSVLVQNVLPAPPNFFIRQGYMVLVNDAKTRIRDLDQTFKIKVGFQKGPDGNYKAKGFLMSLKNYDNQEEMLLCQKQGCFYNFYAVKSTDDDKLKLVWSLAGPQSIAHPITINSVECYFPDGIILVSHADLNITVRGQGLRGVEIKLKEQKDNEIKIETETHNLTAEGEQKPGS